jgi:exonuclease III
MAIRIHRPLKIIAFNVNGIWRQRYELSKQLQDLHIDVALFSETHLKTAWEVLYSKLLPLLNRSSHRKKRQNGHCS